MTFPTAAERTEIEFLAFQDALGSIPLPPGSTRVLMAPSTADANTGKLTLGESRGTATRAVLRFEKQDVVVQNLASDVIDLTTADPNYVNYGSLIGVELADPNKLLKTGIVVPASAPGGNASITSQFKLENLPDEKAIILTTFPTGAIKAGSTFRITVRGTAKAEGAGASPNDSGKLTFKIYIGAPQTSVPASPPTFVMDGQTAVVGPSQFYLEADATVRTAGPAGSYVSDGYGRIEFAPSVVLKPTTTAGAPVDTTAASPVVKLTAQWEKAKAGNILLVETATIEQIT